MDPPRAAARSVGPTPGTRGGIRGSRPSAARRHVGAGDRRRQRHRARVRPAAGRRRGLGHDLRPVRGPPADRDQLDRGEDRGLRPPGREGPGRAHRRHRRAGGGGRGRGRHGAHGQARRRGVLRRWLRDDRPDHADRRRGVAPHGRPQPHRHDARHQARRARDGGAGRRGHRGHLVDSRREHPPVVRRLRPVEGRPRDAVHDGGRRARGQQHSGQHRAAGPHSHRPRRGPDRPRPRARRLPGVHAARPGGRARRGGRARAVPGRTGGCVDHRPEHRHRRWPCVAQGSRPVGHARRRFGVGGRRGVVGS